MASSIFHISKTGDYKVCKAFKVPGRGVQNCPNFVEGAHLDRRAISAVGGGTIIKGGKKHIVSPFQENGTYTILREDGTEHIYNAHNNELVTWRTRRDDKEHMEDIKKEAPYLTPPPLYFDVNDSAYDNDALVASLREFNKARIAGVDFKKIEQFSTKLRDSFIKLIRHAASLKGLEGKDMRHLLHNSLFYLVVEKKSAEEAINAGYKDYLDDKKNDKEFSDPLKMQDLKIAEGRVRIPFEKLRILNFETFNGKPVEIDDQFKGLAGVSKRFALTDEEREVLKTLGVNEIVNIANRELSSKWKEKYGNANKHAQARVNSHDKKLNTSIDGQIHDLIQKFKNSSNYDPLRGNFDMSEKQLSNIAVRLKNPEHVKSVIYGILDDGTAKTLPLRKAIFENSPAVRNTLYNAVESKKIPDAVLERLAKRVDMSKDQFVKTLHKDRDDLEKAS